VIGAAVAFVVSALAGAAARVVGPRVGAVDEPAGELKPHDRPISYLGGAAVAGGIAAGLIARGWPLRLAAGLGLGGALVLGLVDDAGGLPPLLRLALQVVLAVAIVAGGLRADALPEALAWAAAILLLVVAMNGVNLVDGIDGLAAGCVVISSVGLAAIARAHGGGTGLALVAAGAAAGFLLHNLPPARLFLGDGGAYLLGAVIGISVLHAGEAPKTLPGAATCLGMFALDPALAVLRRATGRVSFTRGDRGHLYDQLAARGLAAVPTLGASWGIHSAFVVIGIVSAGLPIGWAVALCSAAWVAAIAILVGAGFVSDGATR
jgi:UDP-GlcNAc:undecaprenyl-phosphate GlcNAc-1-phosphate transferase